MTTILAVTPKVIFYLGYCEIWAISWIVTQETFDAVVKKLKARRMKETLDRLEEDYLDPSQRADPAASDPELARKLAEEHRDPVEQVRNSSVLKLVGHFLE